MVHGNVKPDQFVFSFNDQLLDVVQEYRDLGVVFNSTKCARGNEFKIMLDYITDKSSKASFYHI